MFSANIKYQRNNFYLDTEIKLDVGCITALLGPSGSGKTTLMRLIAGLETPQCGYIRSAGNTLFDDKTNCSVEPQRRKIGMMFQDYALFSHLTIADNIGYGVDKSQRENVVRVWLERINLLDRAYDYPRQLSGGEKQRVALARALASEPDILLLDEPFSALDMLLRHELRREIQFLIQNSGVPVLLATHDLEEARLIADYAYVMEKGTIIRSGEIGEVFRNPANIAAARSLGWQNILPVSGNDKNMIWGAWGQLTLPFDVEPGVLAVGIPKGDICVQSNANALTGEVAHIVQLDNYQILDLRLADNTSLVFEHQSVSGEVRANQTLSIVINCAHLKIFFH